MFAGKTLYRRMYNTDYIDESFKWIKGFIKFY